MAVGAGSLFVGKRNHRTVADRSLLTPVDESERRPSRLSVVVRGHGFSDDVVIDTFGLLRRGRLGFWRGWRLRRRRAGDGGCQGRFGSRVRCWHRWGSGRRARWRCDWRSRRNGSGRSCGDWFCLHHWRCGSVRRRSLGQRCCRGGLRKHSRGFGGRGWSRTFHGFDCLRGPPLKEIIQECRHQRRNPKLQHGNEQVRIVIGALGERGRQSRGSPHGISEPGHDHIVHDRYDQAPDRLPQDHCHDDSRDPAARVRTLGREGFHRLIHDFLPLRRLLHSGHGRESQKKRRKWLSLKFRWPARALLGGAAL